MISSREKRTPRSLEQHAEHLERARTNFDRRQSVNLIPPPEAARVETELFK